jgi:hypothetical protein
MSTWTDISGLFGGLISDAATAPPDITPWFKSAAGGLATGIESGFVAGLKDLWNVILGPMEIAVGVFLILFAVVVVFKEDMIAAARMFGFMGAPV